MVLPAAGGPKIGTSRDNAETEIRELIDSLVDIRKVLAAGDLADKAQLYQAQDLEVRYQHQQQQTIVGVTLCGG
ncbi:hypothetical protein [Nocardia amamiensis]|uniref:hypothetical protein n=1 Tax=Nocardia amamiensis TaxID=404578 RepID=UPI00082CE804|nr:hypothetical protein [Nocardia amamiensis]